MTMVQVAEGRSLFAEQNQCSVKFGLGRIEVEFAGLDKLNSLQWLLHSREQATGSDGGEVIIRRHQGFCQVELRRGRMVEECRLDRIEFDWFVREVAMDIAFARSCPAGRPIITDPDD